MPQVDEELIDFRNPYIITDKMALHLKATKNFVDIYGNQRRAGDEWLIEKSTSDSHTLDAYEQLVQQVWITVLASNQYCIIQNPWDEQGRPRYGIMELRKGEA